MCIYIPHISHSVPRRFTILLEWDRTVDFMASKSLPWHGLTAQLFLKFLLITQPEVPFINMSNWTENGKCTDVTNRRSHVGLSTPIHTNHCYNYKTPDSFWWVFSLSRIFMDLTIHNYRSNQSDAGQIFIISMEFSVVSRRCPSRETPLEPGAKKDGCFCRLL